MLWSVSDNSLPSKAEICSGKVQPTNPHFLNAEMSLLTSTSRVWLFLLLAWGEPLPLTSSWSFPFIREISWTQLLLLFPWLCLSFNKSKYPPLMELFPLQSTSLQLPWLMNIGSILLSKRINQTSNLMSGDWFHSYELRRTERRLHPWMYLWIFWLWRFVPLYHLAIVCLWNWILN